jgi:IMP dehydrogenase/GMP reductase
MQQDLNDYLILQSAQGLNSRSMVEAFDTLPIFTAPMDTVVSANNMQEFISHGINVCLPRNEFFQPENNVFSSLGLEEFMLEVLGDDVVDGEYNGKKILIDIANGNVPLLHESIIKFKQKHPSGIIMAGNVGSVSAFKALAETGCDYIRVGIGGGSGCLTTVHTRVGQGMATLIQECRKAVEENEYSCNIVADGGMQNYGDIVMALALGADYVMLGGIFNRAFESCANKYVETKRGNMKPLEDYLRKHNKTTKELIAEKRMYADFRGMSTKAVQRAWGKKQLKSSEGIVKLNLVEYTLKGWVENFKDYLKSSMAYVGAKNLKEFREFAKIVEISANTRKRFNK